jgi:hypothetical protein
MSHIWQALDSKFPLAIMILKYMCNKDYVLDTEAGPKGDSP